MVTDLDSLKDHYEHREVELIHSKKSKRKFIITECILRQVSETKEEKIVAKGTAICSCKDKYNRKHGNMIARGRALKAFQLKRSLPELPVEEFNRQGIHYSRGIYIS